jgi:sulfur-oxidizing protein SoxY
MKRRDFVAGGSCLGAALAMPAAPVRAQSAPPLAEALAPNPGEFRRVVSEFLAGATPLPDGLRLDVPSLADNPSAVPVKVSVTLPISAQSHCEALIVLAELNPEPLVCRFGFTPALGTAEAAVRVRLTQTQTLHALARMNDGRVLAARQDVTVAASGCGM